MAPSAEPGASPAGDLAPVWPVLADDLIGLAADARQRRRACVSSPAGPAADALTLMRATDEANWQVLWRIVTRIGWPGVWQVGPQGCQAAVEIAVHGDHDVQRQKVLLRSLAGAVMRGDATTAQWAHLLDRCKANAGARQVFGTQFWLTADGPRPHPVTDPRGLDTRRAGAGLPPHSEQLRRLHQQHRLRDDPQWRGTAHGPARPILVSSLADPGADGSRVLAAAGGFR